MKEEIIEILNKMLSNPISMDFETVAEEIDQLYNQKNNSVYCILCDIELINIEGKILQDHKSVLIGNQNVLACKFCSDLL